MLFGGVQQQLVLAIANMFSCQQKRPNIQQPFSSWSFDGTHQRLHQADQARLPSETSWVLSVAAQVRVGKFGNRRIGGVY
jgi:hypothetical protein